MRDTMKKPRHKTPLAAKRARRRRRPYVSMTMRHIGLRELLGKNPRDLATRGTIAIRTSED